mmetsp:Transcript_27320/g.66314  ORF Transcript_27320/g.66314 Transcript_27320/m.66314 type:complete len:207 (-) Transcript_27320:362-982(-)
MCGLKSARRATIASSSSRRSVCSTLASMTLRSCDSSTTCKLAISRSTSNSRVTAAICHDAKYSRSSVRSRSSLRPPLPLLTVNFFTCARTWRASARPRRSSTRARLAPSSVAATVSCTRRTNATTSSTGCVALVNITRPWSASRTRYSLRGVRCSRRSTRCTVLTSAISRPRDRRSSKPTNTSSLRIWHLVCQLTCSSRCACTCSA